ncbi:hypothetical protein SE1_01957 [Enterococcus hirae EnGen0127]|uniref:hypothetical protein n=2 Tax=Enterococcus TaxID=1350 RepID=UPI00032E4D51|nr:hypothetical protein [Enterococcus hirae]EOF57041.1 hypothetical protein SE1_01957 [Enterococcus hirae EnGen0127]
MFNIFTGEKTKLTQDVKIVTEDIKNTNNQLIEDINQKGNLEKMVTGNLDKNIAVCDQVKSEINVPKAKLSELSAEYDVVEDKTKGLRDVSKHRREQLEKISGKLNVMEQKVEDLERNVQGWKGKHEKFKEELLVRKQEINQLKENAQQRVEKLSNRGDKQDQMQNSNKTNRTSRG